MREPRVLVNKEEDPYSWRIVHANKVASYGSESETVAKSHLAAVERSLLRSLMRSIVSNESLKSRSHSARTRSGRRQGAPFDDPRHLEGKSQTCDRLTGLTQHGAMDSTALSNILSD